MQYSAPEACVKKPAGQSWQAAEPSREVWPAGQDAQLPTAFNVVLNPRTTTLANLEMLLVALLALVALLLARMLRSALYRPLEQGRHISYAVTNVSPPTSPSAVTSRASLPLKCPPPHVRHGALSARFTV
jgi:hypothetical protein